MNGHGKVKPVHKKYVVSKPDVLGLKGQKIKEEKGEEGELKTHHMTRKKKKNSTSYKETTETKVSWMEFGFTQRATTSEERPCLFIK